MNKEIMKDLYTFVICIIVVSVTLLVCYHLCIDTTNNDPSLRGQAFGGLMGLGGSAMGYWVATTKSNTDKDKTIAEVLKSTSASTATSTVGVPPVKETTDEKDETQAP